MGHLMCLLMKLLDVENVAESHAIGEPHNFQPATDDASLLHLVTENEFYFKFQWCYVMCIWNGRGEHIIIWICIVEASLTFTVNVWFDDSVKGKQDIKMYRGIFVGEFYLSCWIFTLFRASGINVIFLKLKYVRFYSFCAFSVRLNVRMKTTRLLQSCNVSKVRRWSTRLKVTIRSWQR